MPYIFRPEAIYMISFLFHSYAIYMISFLFQEHPAVQKIYRSLVRLQTLSPYHFQGGTLLVNLFNMSFFILKLLKQLQNNVQLYVDIHMIHQSVPKTFLTTTPKASFQSFSLYLHKVLATFH